MLDLGNLEQPVTEDEDMCGDCRRDEGASLQRVTAIVHTLEESRGRRVLTKAKLVEICEAAAWLAEDIESEEDMDVDLLEDSEEDLEEESEEESEEDSKD
ncbi:hypothetical protein LTR27_012419 [Elasticomyces elasticus]|nr:hypothetical protein LTR27_012419 [Elasticomyces elasticus]